MENMENIPYIFTIFFLTLGPLKIIPLFDRLTHDATAAYRLRVAGLATLISTIIVLMLSGVGRNIITNWKVSPSALALAAGILLLTSALKLLSNFSLPKRIQEHPPMSDKDPRELAISPLAIPAIVTPYGLVAILAFMGNAQGRTGLELSIVAVLLLIMGMNLAGMLLTPLIVRWIGLIPLLIVGWVFAALQAALALEFILAAFRYLGVINY
jgi:multiple antibiotic resistance protein